MKNFTTINPFKFVLVFAIIFFSFDLHPEMNNHVFLGMEFPNLTFELELSSNDQSYLGITGEKTVQLSDINAKIIIIEFTNKYCASCQDQAPVFNHLYDRINNHPDLKQDVKMLGVGVGNNLHQVELFKKDKHIPFPVFTDLNFAVHGAIGNPRAPFTVILKKDETGKLLVCTIHAGYYNRNDDFIDELLKIKNSDWNELKSFLVTIRTDKKVKNKSPFSKGQMMDSIKTRLSRLAIETTEVEHIDSLSAESVFRAEIKKGKQKQILYFTEFYRPTVCDVCHDVHFWIGFDSDYKILMFEPILLAKDYNIRWDKNDIQYIKDKVIGRSLKQEILYDLEVDAVTSATITTGIIYDAINSCEDFIKELQTF